MNDYTNVVLRVQAGDKEAEAELFNLVKRDYYNMVSVIPDSAAASGIFKSAFALTMAHISEVGNPDVYGEWFRMTLEQNISKASSVSQSTAGMGQDRVYNSSEIPQSSGMPDNMGTPYQQAPQNEAVDQFRQTPYSNMGDQFQKAPQNVMGDQYQQMPYNGGMPAAPAKKKSKAPIIIALVGIIAVLAVVAVIVVPRIMKKVNNNDYDKEGYKELIDTYFEAYSNEDMDAMIACYPDEIGETVRESFISQAGGTTDADYWDVMESGYGDDFEITAEITDAVPGDSSDIADLEENIKDVYDVSYDVQYAVKLDLDETCSGSLYEYTFSETVYAAVIDGEWYLIGTSY